MKFWDSIFDIHYVYILHILWFKLWFVSKTKGKKHKYFVNIDCNNWLLIQPFIEHESIKGSVTNNIYSCKISIWSKCNLNMLMLYITILISYPFSPELETDKGYLNQTQRNKYRNHYNPYNHCFCVCIHRGICICCDVVTGGRWRQPAKEIIKVSRKIIMM